jgi:type II secretory pathway pseudopilin PulG
MRSRARRGITLFESVAALTIVALVGVSALETAGSEMRTAERARRALEAEALTTQRLDWMDLMTDQELQAIPDSVASGTFTEPLDEYSWKTTSVPIAKQPGVYAVTVQVSWDGGTYAQHTEMYRRPQQITSARGP